MGLPGCGNRGVSAPVPGAVPLLLSHTCVEPEETLGHRGLLQGWGQAAGCLCPSSWCPMPWETQMLQKTGPAAQWVMAVRGKEGKKGLVREKARR